MRPREEVGAEEEEGMETVKSVREDGSSARSHEWAEEGEGEEGEGECSRLGRAMAVV